MTWLLYKSVTLIFVRRDNSSVIAILLLQRNSFRMMMTNWGKISTIHMRLFVVIFEVRYSLVASFANTFMIWNTFAHFLIFLDQTVHFFFTNFSFLSRLFTTFKFEIRLQISFLYFDYSGWLVAFAFTYITLTLHFFFDSWNHARRCWGHACAHTRLYNFFFRHIG